MSESTKKYLVKEAIIHGEYQAIGTIVEMPEKEAERYVTAKMLEPVDEELTESEGEHKKTSSKNSSKKEKDKKTDDKDQKEDGESKDPADKDPIL